MNEVCVLFPISHQKQHPERLLHRFCLLHEQVQSAYALSLHFIVVENSGIAEKRRQWKQLCTQSCPLTLLLHPEQRSHASALLTGLRHITMHHPNCQYLCIAPYDHCIDPTNFLCMLHKLYAPDVSPSYDIISSYFAVPPSSHPTIYQLLQAGEQFLYDFLFDIDGIGHYNYNLTLYRTSLIKLAFRLYGDRLLTGNPFACTTGLLYKLSLLGAHCTEIALPFYNDKSIYKKNHLSSIGSSLQNIAEAYNLHQHVKKPNF